ncbi:uncharacterized protein [Rutidosis leptorrhynchoides]|uniref:uncharacterized protein n=1 Tax=Rutidosis leptorrhynchoides TaxID=125765 RepID=UPI003A991732
MTGDISNGFNSSFTTLVPKKTDPVSLNEYRPISLIGSYYKIIVKLLSLRIRKVIPNLIGFEQSAFIRGRNIMDGALIANESYAFLKTKRIKSMLFKVDFEKAFDSLSWEFSDDMMGIMGFGKKWRGWIASCLKSASVSVLVNGTPTKEFKLGRGVRQGDPLSSFLFIIATEGLNWLTKSAVSNNLYSGVEIDKDKVPISHLQYADDTLFFGSWSLDNIENLMKLLKCFELCSGLKINYNKSNPFGVGVDMKEVEYMAHLFGCNVGVFPFTYLGQPIGANMKKIASWKPVIDKFEKRLADWKSRTMSFGGRLTLVTSVLNSLPLYYFSLFRAPHCVLNKLECVRRKFFWGGAGEESKISWVKWDEVIRPWTDGGLNIGIHGVLGILNSGGVNSLDNSNFPWSTIVKTGFEIDGLGVDFSKSFSRVIGDGSNTLFWEDIWIKDKPLKDLFNRLFRLESNGKASVADRIKRDGSSFVPNWSWISEVKGRMAGEVSRLNEMMLDIKLADGKMDRWSWKLCGSGLFSTKSLTKVIMGKCLSQTTNNTPTLRNRLVPLKVAVFIWRARRNRLPVLSELDKRGIDLHSVLCPLCEEAVEKVDHALFSCKKVQEIWVKVFKWWGIGSTQLGFDDILSRNTLTQCSDAGAKIWQAMVWTSTYLIWQKRNLKVFKKECWSPPVALNDIQIKSYDWIAKRCKTKSIEWFDWLQNPHSLIL